MEKEADYKLPGGMTRILLILTWSVIGCHKNQNSADSNHCRILVAASARDVTQLAIDEFLTRGASIDDCKVEVVSGPSNSLAQMILSGAPADIYISANPRWTEAVSENCDSIEAFLGNRLVLATHRLNEQVIDSIDSLDDESGGRIAIGAQAVPVGDYARQAIGRLSQQQQEAVNAKLVFGKDSSALIAWLENREADFGFVYESDANRSADLKIVLAFGPQSHDPIEYTIATLNNGDAKSSILRDEVYQWLRSDKIQATYGNAGFTLPNRNRPVDSKSID